MNKNNMLTRFDEGKSHEQNALGGVPIGNNNSVEQGETKQNNFVYSNRIILDAPTVSQYNLPKSLIGKSVADATKLIDNKFKGRNDKISQSTKNSMLSKIAEAQESMKPQEPETEQSYPQEERNPSQMAYGGDIDIMKGQQLGDTFVNTAATGADMIAPGTGQILKAGDQLGQSIGESIGGDRGESIGGLINPMGTLRGLGSAVKTGNLNDIPGIGIFGGKTSRQKAAIENTNNFVSKQYNNKYNTQWGDGGVLPYEKITTQQLQNTTIVPNTNPNVQTDRFRYAVGEQGGVQHGPLGEQGHYLYYGKKPGDAGFNPAVHREFVNQGGYDTYMKSPQGQQYRRNLSTQSLQPIEQLGCGGKVKKMGDGGPLDEVFKVKQNLYPQAIQNLKPDNSVTDSSVLKQYNNEILNPGLFDTQKTLDGDRYSLENRLGRFGTTVNENAGNLARYAPIAANAYQLAKLKKPEMERLDRLGNRYKPEYVDEAQLQNIANQTMNNTVNAISQSGASQGQTRASILGSQLERTKALSDAYSQAAVQNRATNDRAQQFNLGIDSTNLQQSNAELDINDRNQAAYDTEKSKLIGKIGENIGNVGNEQVYKKIAITTTGYNWLAEYQKANPTATAEEAVTAAKKAGVIVDDTKTTKKNALGGYLIKNKIK